MLTVQVFFIQSHLFLPRCSSCAAFVTRQLLSSRINFSRPLSFCHWLVFSPVCFPFANTVRLPVNVCIHLRLPSPQISGTLLLIETPCRVVTQHRCQPSRNHAGNPAFWLFPRIPAFLRNFPHFWLDFEIT